MSPLMSSPVFQSSAGSPDMKTKPFALVAMLNGMLLFRVASPSAPHSYTRFNAITGDSSWRMYASMYPALRSGTPQGAGAGCNCQITAQVAHRDITLTEPDHPGFLSGARDRGAPPKQCRLPGLDHQKHSTRQPRGRRLHPQQRYDVRSEG